MGRIGVRFSVRSHLAFVDITFDEATYSITYKDSHNLDYKKSKGREKIHRNYNKWVHTLNRELQRALFATQPATSDGPEQHGDSR